MLKTPCTTCDRNSGLIWTIPGAHRAELVRVGEGTRGAEPHPCPDCTEARLTSLCFHPAGFPGRGGVDIVANLGPKWGLTGLCLYRVRRHRITGDTWEIRALGCGERPKPGCVEAVYASVQVSADGRIRRAA